MLYTEEHNAQRLWWRTVYNEVNWRAFAYKRDVRSVEVPEELAKWYVLCTVERCRTQALARTRANDIPAALEWLI